MLLSSVTYDPAVAAVCGQNPAGEFTFGMEQSLGGTFSANTQKRQANDSNSNPWVYEWQAPDVGVPLAGANVGTRAWTDPSNSNVTVPGDCVIMQPDSSGDYAVMRFTAPAAGVYDINATFSGVDASYWTTDVHVLVNGVSLFDGNVLGSPVSAPPETLMLDAGSTVDFAVGDGGTARGDYDSTALNLSITTNSSSPFSVQMIPIYAPPGTVNAPIADFWINDPTITPGDVSASVSLDNPTSTSIVPLGGGEYEVDLNCTATDDMTYAGDPADYSLTITGDGQTYSSPTLPLYVTTQGSAGAVAGSSLATVAGSSLAGTLGSFYDPNNSTNDASVYGVQIDWGNGDVTCDASVTADTNNSGNFLISDPYAYSAPGAYTPQITVYGNDGVWMGTANVTVTTTTTTTFDLAAPFAANYGDNPSGSFSFGSEASPGATFTLMTGPGNTVYDSNSNPWVYESQPSSDNFPLFFGLNVGNQPYTDPATPDVTVPADCVVMQSDASGDDAVTRFTAPTAGVYTINADFFSVDSNHGGADVHILVNGSSAFNGDVLDTTIVAPTQTLTLNANDTVDFVVGSAFGNWCYGSTALSVSITATVSAGPFNVQMLPIYAAPGVQVTAPIAQFTINDPNIEPNDITACTNLGGDVPTSIVPLDQGRYDVYVTFTPTDGAMYASDPVDYYLNLQADGQSFCSPSLPIFVTTQGSPGPLNNVSLTATEGTSLTASLGDFTDPNNANDDPTIYCVQTVWGDGTVTLDGSVTANPSVAGDFLVDDSHTYSSPGTFFPQVTVFGNDGVWVGADTITVAADPIPVNLSTTQINASDQQPLTGTIATFTTTDASATAGNFTATIFWNDGSAPDTASVCPDPGGGFDIIDTHPFVAGGVFFPTIELDSNGAESAVHGCMAIVTDPCLFVSADVVSVTSGTATTNYTVADFYDDNYYYNPAVTATVDWLDGSSPVPGTVTYVGDGNYTVTAPYTATMTENLAPQVTVADDHGSAYVADPPLVVNIDTSAGAVEGQVFTLGLSASGLGVGDISSWIVIWGDGATTSNIPADSLSVTHTYDDDSNNNVPSATITAEALNAWGGVLQTATADPLPIAPIAPDNIENNWGYSPGNTPSMSFYWLNNSSIADGYEIDELSGDGQTYSTVCTGSFIYGTASDTIDVPSPDPDATYYVYATDNNGATYSDPAVIQPGIVPPVLTETYVGPNSVTLAYGDPSNANMTLYYDIPGVDNMHAYTDLSPGDGTVNVYGLSFDQVYSFQIDAYTADQDVKSNVANDLGASPPVITDVEPITNGGTFQGEFAITFTTTDPNLLVGGEFAGRAQLAAWTSGDTYHLYPGDWTGSDLLEGQSPRTYCSSQSGGVYTITATYYIPTYDPSVDLQIVAPNAPPSAVYTLSLNGGDQIDGGPTPVEITGLNADLTRDGMTDIVYDPSFPGSQGTPNYSNEIVDFYDVANGQATFIGEQDDYYGSGLPNLIDQNWYVSPAVISNSLLPPGSQVFAVSLAYTDAGGTVWMHSDYSSPITVPGTASNAAVPLIAPSNLTAELVDNGMFLHWQDNSDDEDNFVIVARAHTADDSGTWVPVTSVGADVTCTTVTPDEISGAMGSSAALAGADIGVLADGTDSDVAQPAAGIAKDFGSLYAKYYAIFYNFARGNWAHGIIADAYRTANKNTTNFLNQTIQSIITRQRNSPNTTLNQQWLSTHGDAAISALPAKIKNAISGPLNSRPDIYSALAPTLPFFAGVSTLYEIKPAGDASGALREAKGYIQALAIFGLKAPVSLGPKGAPGTASRSPEATPFGMLTWSSTQDGTILYQYTTPTTEADKAAVRAQVVANQAVFDGIACRAHDKAWEEAASNGPTVGPDNGNVLVSVNLYGQQKWVLSRDLWQYMQTRHPEQGDFPPTPEEIFDAASTYEWDAPTIQKAKMILQEAEEQEVMNGED